MDIGDAIIGYGDFVEVYEGGDSLTFGGVFIYSKNDKSIRKLTDYPTAIIEIKDDYFLGKSMIFNMAPALQLKEYSFSKESNIIKIEKELNITDKCYGKKDGEIIKLNTNYFRNTYGINAILDKSLDFTIDEKEYKKQWAFYEEIQLKKKARVNVEKLLNMKVEFTTVPIKKDKVEILKF